MEATGNSDVGAVLGTGEVGYSFRPAPALTVAPILGVGVGYAIREGVGGAEDEDGYSLHGMALVRASWQQRLWFASFDAGWAQSGSYADELSIAGPVVRMVVGLRL
jgi:hypothetical protein